MSKILVEVFIPAIDKSYEIYIPLTSKLHEVEELITKACTDLSKGYFIENESVLCDYYSGGLFDRNKTILDNGIKNGNRILLL